MQRIKFALPTGPVRVLELVQHMFSRDAPDLGFEIRIIKEPPLQFGRVDALICLGVGGVDSRVMWVFQEALNEGFRVVNFWDVAIIASPLDGNCVLCLHLDNFFRIAFRYST